MSRPLALAPLVGAALLLAAGCDTATEPLAPPRAPSLLATAPLPVPLHCPTQLTLSGQALIGPSGGTVRAGGHAIVIPPGALEETRLFTLTAPSGSLLLVDASAEGETHYQFSRAVRVEVDYGRCPKGVLAAGTLSAWYVDGLPLQLLERMEGSDERARRTYVFYTDHFSGYVIAN